MNLFQSRDEVRVWQRQRNGRTIWYAYSPKTEKQLSFSDYSQLREWLDNYDPGEAPHRVAINWAGGPNTHPLRFSFSGR